MQSTSYNCFIKHAFTYHDIPAFLQKRGKNSPKIVEMVEVEEI